MEHLPPLSDDEIIEVYHNGRPLHETARQYNVRQYWLEQQIIRLRAEGKLPSGRRAVNTSYRLEHTTVSLDIEGRPNVSSLHGYDKLLEDLYNEHIDPRFDIPAGLK